jgi:putative SOS response-associated peptidase YedK
MCGKFTQMATWPEVVAFSQPLVATPEGAPTTVSTPMRMAKVIRLGEDGKPELVSMRWGYTKAGAAGFKPDHMHARSETIDTRERFAESFAERRGIVLVETFNEAEELPDGKRKQWVISPKDRKSIAIAVIWEDWQGPEGPIPCFVMVTVPPNELIARVTDRMPAILEQKDWPMWIGEKDAPLDEVKALLKTFDDKGNWDMSPQGSAPKTKPEGSAKKKPQMDLF